MMVLAPQLETKRLLLNDIQESDTELIVKWRSDPNIYKYFCSPHPLVLEEHLSWYRESYIFNSNRFDFMASLKDNGTSIGVFGIKRIKEDINSAEVSYIVAPEMQGQGYALEAITRLHKYIKEEWHCTETVAVIHKDNLKSIKFAENLGYRCVEKKGTFLCLKREI